MPTERATERRENGVRAGSPVQTHTQSPPASQAAQGEGSGGKPSAGPRAAGDAGSPCQVLRPRQRASVAPIHPCCTGPTAHRTERLARQNGGPGGGGLCSLAGPRARAARTKTARPVGCPHLPYPCLGGPRGTAPGHLTPPQQWAWVLSVLISPCPPDALQAWPSLGARDSLCQPGRAASAHLEVEHAHATWGPVVTPFLQLQVLGTLAVLWLGAVTLAYVLWQVRLPPTCGQLHPEEGPTGSRGHSSSLAWEPLGGEAGQQPQDSCRLVLVESIPQDLPSAAGSPSAQPLAQAWLQLLDAAQESIHVASFYWSLTGPDIGVNDSSSQPGEALLQKLAQLLDKNISLAVATSSPSLTKNSTDLRVLVARGAQVRFVPMRKLTGGVLHSKFWVVDGRHIYLGSANMDWRALTQVKELGAIIYNCSHLALDLEKIFQTYWVLGAPRAVLPRTWPQNFSTHINRFQPLRGRFDGVPTTAYFSASPPSLCPHGRTRDLEALLAVMGGAREFIYASVMEYFPTTRFSHPPRYWPVLDTALRTAAFNRGVRVRLLVSCWPHTDPSMFPELRSLQAFSNPVAGVSVDVKVFIVPVGNHSNIPFSRVNHSKFMVTEKAAYIGTSNWSEDYFSSTSGVGLVVSQRAPGTRPAGPTVQEQLRRLFERDWDSRYAVGLDGQAQGQDCAWQG